VFSQREEKRGERLLDVLTDEENGLRLIVSRLGAELISLARRNADGEWIGFLNRDNQIDPPEKGWANHATVMGYFLHRIKDERTIYRGQEIRGGTHSFLRGKVWHRGGAAGMEPAGSGATSPKPATPVSLGRGEAISPAENELIYRITPEDFSVAEYPLKVSLDLTYRIDAGRVSITFKFKNDEPKLTAHVGFGLHPGFAATSFDSFHFEMPAGLYRRHFSPDNYLSGETEDIRFAGGEMPFARDKLRGSYILELVDIPDRTFTFVDPPSGRTVATDLTGVPYLTLWSDGGPFLCVEPCWGLTDHHDQRAFENKEGIQKIPPEETLVASFSFEPRLA
jgi:galactose mutarotase-like enzyme